MSKIINFYRNAFQGLSKEIWWLALITLINRSGAVVMLFLTLYLTQELGFTKGQVGWIMTFYGLGAVVGSWLGGVLTEKFGFHKVMTFSLVLTGITFISLQFVKTFELFCAGMFIAISIADTFGPASYVALTSYSKPENTTRSLTLIRLAISLGFSLGPFMAGVIVTSLGYSSLFWVDGVTCLITAILFFQILHPKKTVVQEEEVNENALPIQTDKIYVVFLIGLVFLAFAFMQYFSTMPLYYKEVHNFDEFGIGILMAMYGVLVFVFEMPVIKWLESKNYSLISLTIFGFSLLASSFLIVNLVSWSGILYVGIIVMTIGEMIASPMSNTFAIERSKRGSKAQYMAMYAMAFALANVVSHNFGMHLTEKIGYKQTIYVVFGIATIGVLLMISTKFMLKKES